MARQDQIFLQIAERSGHNPLVLTMCVMFCSVECDIPGKGGLSLSCQLPLYARLIMTPIWCHTFSFSYPSLHTTHGGMKFQILLERSLIILYRGCSKSLKLPIISHKIQKVVLKNSSWDIWERAQNSWLVLLVVNVYLLVALILFGIRPNESRACLTSQIGLSVQYKNSKSYHTFPNEN